MCWRTMTRLWQQRLSLRSRIAMQQTLIFGLLSVYLAWSTFTVKLQQHVFLLLLRLPLSVLLAGVASWVVAMRALAPLQQISEAARAISLTDLSGRLPLPGTNDEFDDLSTILNAMISRLQSSIQQMQEFLPNASHELRRTLTALYAEAEHALRRSAGEKDYRAALSNQLQQITLTCSSISDLLTVAQNPSGTIQPVRQEESLSEVVSIAAEAMRATAAGHNIEIVTAVEENLKAEVDAGHLWRLLLNLLDNAIKFNRPQGCVEVVLASHENQAMISVRDTGCGIAPADLPHIFERSYRSPRARRSGVQGSGLGLSFVRAITEAYGGRIEVQSTPGEGSCFRLWLPLLLPAAVAHGYSGFSGVRPMLN
jgi:two-component system, OmpR family, sensor kinase